MNFETTIFLNNRNRKIDLGDLKVRGNVTLSGKSIPATLIEPAENPEFEVYDIECWLYSIKKWLPIDRWKKHEDDIQKLVELGIIENYDEVTL